MELSEVFSETDNSEAAPTKVDELEEGSTAEEESTVDDGATTTVAEQDETVTQEPSKKEEGEWTYAAYQDEKRKRQELEQRLKDIETKPEDDDTDYIPQSELKKRLEVEYEQKLKQTIFQDRLSRTYEETKSKYDDFKEMESKFADMATKDSILREHFLNSQNPAEFAYIQAKNHALLSKYNGNIMAMLEDVKKQAKTEESEAPAPKTSKAPSLATATESEKNSAPTTPNTTLAGIFADSPF